jgi:hypothetical protein
MFVEPLGPLFGRPNVRLAITAGYVRSIGRMAEVPHGWVFHYAKNRSTHEFSVS